MILADALGSVSFAIVGMGMDFKPYIRMGEKKHGDGVELAFGP